MFFFPALNTALTCHSCYSHLRFLPSPSYSSISMPLSRLLFSPFSRFSTRTISESVYHIRTFNVVGGAGCYGEANRLRRSSIICLSKQCLVVRLGYPKMNNFYHSVLGCGGRRPGRLCFEILAYTFCCHILLLQFFFPHIPQ